MGTFARSILGGGSVAALLLITACSESSSSEVAAEAGEDIAPWELGAAIGTVVGPFPTPREAAQNSAQGSWFSAVLPSGSPIEAFEAVVADAEAHGFDAFSASTGACRLVWGREEVPFDTESGTDDGLGFGGDIAVGEPLPSGAEVEGARCRAVVVRAELPILVTVEAWRSSAAVFPSRTAVFLSSAVDDIPDSDFESVNADVDVEPRHNGPPTDREDEMFGEATDLPEFEIIDVSIPGLQCKAGAIRSALSVRAAVTEAFERVRPDGIPVDPTVVTTTIGDWPAATAVGIVPADGPVVYGMATETESGSSQLFCSQQF